MKKAFQISIGGAVFTFEDDAYARLDGYLNSIKAHFANKSERDEIVRDIESRIAEQLGETGHTIIDICDVESVISSMGRIEDFGGEAKADAGKKKLYRNPDDAIIAGVCSGLGAYFGIDAVWVRIAFVILAFSTGLTIILYIVLWIIMPEAKSASQKLEMSGSPVNISTLSESVKEKVEEVRERHGSKLTKVLRAPFTFIRQIAQLISKRFFPLIRIATGSALALASLAGVLILSFATPLLLIDADTYTGIPVSEILTRPLLFSAILGIYFTIVIPLVALFGLSIGMIRNKSTINGTLALTLLFLWSVAVVGGSVASFMSAERIDARDQTRPLFEKKALFLPVTGETKKIHIGDGIYTTVIQGESASIVAEGDSRAVEGIRASEVDGILSLSVERGVGTSRFCLFCGFNPARVTVTLPRVEEIRATHGSHVTVPSWASETPVSVSLRHGSRGTFTIDVDDFTARADHGSIVTIDGKAISLNLSAEHGSLINASSVETDKATIAADQGSRVIYTAEEDESTESSSNGPSIERR